MSKQASHFYEFGPFRVDTEERILLKEGHPLPLPPKVFDTLLALVEKSGRIVEKDELMKTVWPDTFVEESNLTVNISVLRRTLHEGSSEQQYIETVSKRGYRFTANVRELMGEASGVQREELADSHTAPEEKRRTEQKTENLTEQEKNMTRLAAPDNLRLSFALNKTVVIGIALLVALIVPLSYFWISTRSKQTQTNAAVRTIAVLPFNPMSAEGTDEYLGLGMADALITRLSNIREVIVRPTSAVRKYTGAQREAVSIGQELRVDAVLEGSIQRLGDRIRVTVQLVNVRDGSPLWADTFDEKLTDVFKLEDAISERMTGALPLKLTGEEKRLLTKRYTENSEAYQAYIKGRYYSFKFTEDGIDKGIEYFHQAIELDPRYALAYAGLADAYTIAADWHLSPGEAMQKARAAAKRALEIDETLAEAHTSMAIVNLNYDWKWDAAESEFKRAIQLNPSYAPAHILYGEYLAIMQRFDESLAEMKRALELDPLSPDINTLQGEPFYFAREYDRAIDQFKKAAEMAPDLWLAHYYLGLAYEQKGDSPRAVSEFQKAMAIDEIPEVMSGLGHNYAVSGRKKEALKLLEELKEQSNQRYVSPYDMAIIQAALGDKDLAVASLQAAYEDRSEWMLLLKVDPRLDSLRSDQRFEVLTRQVGLTP